MKRLILSILTLIPFLGHCQDSTAYALFNSIYADNHYTLVDNADSYLLDTLRDNLILQECKRIMPRHLFTSLVDNKSSSFHWDKTKLRGTNVISDTTSSKEGKQNLILSSPIFDSTKTFAVILETFDSISCINIGTRLFQFKDNKWTQVASQINSYRLMTTIPRE